MNRLALSPERRAGCFAVTVMSKDAAFLREQAHRCRRLARAVATPDVVATLNQMASEYEERADRLESKK